MGQTFQPRWSEITDVKRGFLHKEREAAIKSEI